jgi:hypothetical protein
MPPARSPSRYESLPDDERWGNRRPWTRILHLHSGSGSTPLGATLKIEDIERCVGYDALSYVWGQDECEHALIRDGIPVKIKAN